MGRHVRSAASWLIIGTFSLLAGVAFVGRVDEFFDLSRQTVSAAGGLSLNVNQLLIRPFFLQVGAIALFLLPLHTARAFAPPVTESACDPLLPASRIAAVRLVAAAFVSTYAIYVVMLLASLALVMTLFLFGAPEPGPVASGYLGLLLGGAAFIAAALFVSSVCETPVGAGIATLAVSSVVAASAWLGRAGTPAAQAMFGRFTVADALDDFAKGVIDSGHVVSCLAVTAVGLYAAVHGLASRGRSN